MPASNPTPRRTARAPFIWTPRQALDPQGFSALKRDLLRREEGRNRWFLFRRRFALPDKPQRAAVDLTVDGRYLLYVNGRKVGRGPARCSPLFQRFDTHDIASQLRAGDNLVAVLVHVYGVDTAFYETVKGLWQPCFGDGGLWMQGSASAAGWQCEIASDAQWRCFQSEAWTRDTPRTNQALGFIEDLDARKLPAGWTELEFDDSAWEFARPLLVDGGGPEAARGGPLIQPFPVLVPRGLPHARERPVAAQRVLWIKGQVPCPELPIERRIYEEPFCEAPSEAVTHAQDLLRIADGAALIRTREGCDVAFLLDFGRIFAGYPRLEIEARGGEIVELACCERLAGEWGSSGLAPDARIKPFPALGNDTHLCRYVARPGRQAFERFEWCAIRWMHVVVRNAPQGLKVLGIGATATGYPVENRGRFECSDTLLTKLWSTGAYTVSVCMHDGWIDCPSREQRQWLGDATVENLVAHAAFGPEAGPLNAQFLRHAAESQRADGLTQPFAPGDHKRDGCYLIPDWTLQWILNAADHWLLTGDLGTIEAIFPAIQKALAWFEPLLGPTGLVADLPYWHFIDWAGVGRQGEAATLNALLAGSFEAAAILAQALGYERADRRYRARAVAIAGALNQRHWDEQRGVYVDSVDPRSGQRARRVSQHANAAMALWGRAPKPRLKRALDRVGDRRRLTFTAAPPVVPTGETLEPEEGVVLANTFFSHFVYEALARHGRVATALRLMRERFGPMLAQGATTLWESYTPHASLCHGFSASPTYQLSRHVLGVAPAAPGFSRLKLKPDLADLDWAEGVVPTPHGDAAVRLERAGDGFVVQAQAPAHAPIELDLAPGLLLRSGAVAAAAGKRLEAKLALNSGVSA